VASPTQFFLDLNDLRDSDSKSARSESCSPSLHGLHSRAYPHHLLLDISSVPKPELGINCLHGLLVTIVHNDRSNQQCCRQPQEPLTLSKPLSHRGIQGHFTPLNTCAIEQTKHYTILTPVMIRQANVCWTLIQSQVHGSASISYGILEATKQDRLMPKRISAYSLTLTMYITRPLLNAMSHAGRTRLGGLFTYMCAVVWSL
jgi:hypothetical protein